MDVAKETQIQSLSVKIKGKAEVCWSEHYGQTTVVYSDKEKFYSMKRFFILEEKTQGNGHEMLNDPSGRPYSSVVASGRHVYLFAFQLPQQHFPPSFKGSVGKIVYSLEAKLERAMRISTKDKAEFHYAPKPDLPGPELMAPQYGTKDKQMKLFTSGSVSMNINTEKMGYYLGEGLKVLAEVQNNSSRSVKPKYCLYEKHSFLAKGKRRLHTHNILKDEGEPIEPNSKKTVTKLLSIPPSLTISVLNCRILKVEYRLRVYLNVPYTSDPEIKFPVVILPPQPAKNSDFGIWNQPPGSNMYPNPLPIVPLNVVGPSGPSGASGYSGPPDAQFGAHSSPAPPGQLGPFSQQFDPSAPPPYQDYQLYPKLPDHPEKS
ncbi:arrestin domain-containing 3-like protein [Labeo rohita]|uniref:Arrestin domain-containing 3-like protein n=1 Tax=Labeo rohita TaxID=84645 RepID=A0A498NPU3_LABRO|nr:arrestin domain-containing 3-like protein [Labeo rohita]RXN36908.1 arrestin domain-containing 3-like protein [Labeo rohita]